MRVDDERETLIRQISETQRGLGRLLAQDRSPLFDSNLTMRQLKVVILLSCTGSASGQELAGNLGVGLGTVTGIVDRLVGHGLVTRHEDPHDRRVRRVQLTDAGRALVEEINDAGLRNYRRIMERLDLDSLRSLADITAKIAAIAAELPFPRHNTTAAH
ncbi:MarR family winged helix-turn-helix transcriptional regulator [Nonomuraea dietziae]|uniref:DNA-binding MarR family transcriptional regulator n=2 Tax=Nonomuraea dietziae TaxID=65515 RepID=A0A7W5YPD3_9ACTN|nr:MarR family transcriptional regulator [Nonomuraea dietziae]MBB3725004.1 DNA-binding MarR family transcriptional regulator [Nonomuraea dietziae]